MYYPVFLDLRGKSVLVVGAGKVALRKVRGLLEAGAVITIVSPEMLPEFETLAVSQKRRRFRPADVRNHSLVYAATSDRAVNHSVAQAAAAAGIPVNVADAPAECTFLVPARIRRGHLQIAVSTSGRSPRLAVDIRKRIEAILTDYRDS